MSVDKTHLLYCIVFELKKIHLKMGLIASEKERNICIVYGNKVLSVNKRP